MSTPAGSRFGFEPASRLILNEIARGFEDLSGRLQHAIDILPPGDPEAAALRRIRDKTFHAGLRVREEIDRHEPWN
jgi:hypothetical protein